MYFPFEILSEAVRTDIKVKFNRKVVSIYSLVEELNDTIEVQNLLIWLTHEVAKCILAFILVLNVLINVSSNTSLSLSLINKFCTSIVSFNSSTKEYILTTFLLNLS